MQFKASRRSGEIPAHKRWKHIEKANRICAALREEKQISVFCSEQIAKTRCAGVYERKEFVIQLSLLRVWDEFVSICWRVNKMRWVTEGQSGVKNECRLLKNVTAFQTIPFNPSKHGYKTATR